MSGEGAIRSGPRRRGALPRRRGPLWASHYHCADCRRSSGAPVSTFVGVRSGAFRFVSGTPGTHESSPGVARKFCRDCGTPLTYEASVYPGEVHVMAGSLDAPEEIAPRRHVFVRERLPWFEIGDALPRHDTLPRGVPRP